MTYSDYVLAVLGKFGLSTADVEFILVEADLSGDTVVNGPEDRIKLKTAIYNQVPLMIAGLREVSEGGFSIKWNIDGLKAWYSLLAAELGLEDLLAEKNSVRDASDRW